MGPEVYFSVTHAPHRPIVFHRHDTVLIRKGLITSIGSCTSNFTEDPLFVYTIASI